MVVFHKHSKQTWGQASRQDGVGACFGAGTQMPSVPVFGPQLFLILEVILVWVKWI